MKHWCTYRGAYRGIVALLIAGVRDSMLRSAGDKHAGDRHRKPLATSPFRLRRRRTMRFRKLYGSSWTRRSPAISTRWSSGA